MLMFVCEDGTLGSLLEHSVADGSSVNVHVLPRLNVRFYAKMYSNCVGCNYPIESYKVGFNVGGAS